MGQSPTSKADVFPRDTSEAKEGGAVWISKETPERWSFTRFPRTLSPGYRTDQWYGPVTSNWKSSCQLRKKDNIPCIEGYLW